MMYNQKLVASLKANGKILREFKDTTYIPFGSEYSILIKNLNSVRALVNVFIDGEDMTPGGLVVNAGQEVYLERSIKNGNLLEGNKFKFIERTSSVENHRGIKLEDGLIRIEFQFEKPYVPSTYLNDWYYKRECYGSGFGNKYGSPQIWGSVTNDSYSVSSAAKEYSALRSVNTSSAILNNVNLSASAQSYNETGITVPGSKSEQKFVTTHIGQLETEKHTIVLKILGETPDNKMIREPVTVKHKPKCVTCGKQNKATAKFCTECGTHLEIFA